MGYELDESKTKYFVIAIILLIILGVVLVVHFNNKSLVSGELEDISTTETTTTQVIDSEIEEYEYKNDEEKIIKINNTNPDKEEINVEAVENIDKEEINVGTLENIDKEEIDLTNVTIDLKINGEVVSDYSNMYVSTLDKVSVVVNGLDVDYKIYSLLQNEDNINSYVEFKEDLFSSIETPNKYKLSIKLEVDGVVKVFEVGIVNVYDIVFVYDKNEEVTEDVIIGTIVDKNEVESTYVDKDTNKNIVIDSVEKEETEQEEPREEEIVNENEQIEIDVPKETDNNLNGENLEDKATIKLKGNIYLVEKTDISNLEMTGHLIIDTNEDITFANENDKLLASNLYTITIKSKEFSLNGIKYTYEFIDSKIVIKRIEEENEVLVEDFGDLFNNYHINTSNEDLTLETYLD